MTLFTLDLGNKQVKLLSDRATKVLPSYFVEISQYGNRGLLSFAKNEAKTSDYSSNKDEGFTYVWGNELDVDSVDVITDTIGFGVGRYTSRNFKLLTDFALGELAKDYGDATTDILEVDVSTGLPTSDYMQPPAITALAKAIKGDHSVTVNGKPLNIRVNNLFILPQSLGTVLNEIADDKGDIIETPLTKADIGVVDVGGGTILIDSLRKMNLVENKRMQLEQGAYTLYDALQKVISNAGYNISTYELERVIRKGNKEERYEWSPDGVKLIDITAHVMKQRKLFTRNIANAIKTAFKGFGRMQTLLITGGGANLLIKEDFVEELPIAKFVKNSEIASLYGFRKYAIQGGAIM